jgi:hypothetical protein
MPQSLARTLCPRDPVSRIKARPWVRSTHVTDSPGACAAMRSGSSAAARPGAASSSHSPGPEPTTSVPAASLSARPNRTPSAAAAWPPIGARTCSLASGVQSVIVSSAAARRPLTSQPSFMTTGGAAAIGLRAITSNTHPPPVRVDVGLLRHDPGLDAAAARQPHGDHAARLGEAGVHLGQADGPAQCR